MQTKFILHGGFTPGDYRSDEFTNEILKDTPESLKVLLVYFAKEQDRMAVNSAEDISQFNKHKGDKKLTFEIATESNLVEQVKEADIVYLHGGKTLKLLETLRRFPDLGKLFADKIIAGDSAGANVLCKAFYSKNANVAAEGLGILPLKIICHYKEELKDKIKDFCPGLETLYLREYELKVIFSK